jgi:nitrous oxidase accessory protein NosD
MLVKLISRALNDKTFVVSLTASTLTSASPLPPRRHRREARRFVSLIAVSALLSVSLFVSAAAKVRIKGKPGTFTTIQQAVDAADPGDTVIVHHDTYAENVTIEKSLTLRGAGHSLLAPASGVPLRVDNPAGSVVIEGLDINTPSGQTGIFYDGLSDDDANLGVVRNCTITGGQTGIFARECDLKIRNNDISGFSGSPSSRGLLAIGLGSTTRIVATHNRIVGQPVAGSQGMSILTASIRIRNNDVRSTFSSAIQVFQTDGVIRLNQLTDNRLGVNLIQSPNCLVERNVAESTAAFTASVNAQNLSVGHLRVADASNNAQIRNNTLIGGNLGISILGCVGVVIDSNVVRDTVSAGLIIGVGISVISGSAGVEANNNNIEGNASFGMLVAGASGVVNATNNWWGSGDGPSGVGPGSGDAVTANVNFSPFLTAPNPAAGD